MSEKNTLNQAPSTLSHVPPYSFDQMIPPFYSWGSTLPPPSQPKPHVSKFSIPPRRPQVNADFTQHALNTVVAAAGAIASNALKSNPSLKETPHIRTGLAGVKRKALATELLSSNSGRDDTLLHVYL